MASNDRPPHSCEEPNDSAWLVLPLAPTKVLSLPILGERKERESSWSWSKSDTVSTFHSFSMHELLNRTKRRLYIDFGTESCSLFVDQDIGSNKGCLCAVAMPLAEYPVGSFLCSRRTLFSLKLCLGVTLGALYLGGHVGMRRRMRQMPRKFKMGRR